jgi:hypothetical protein
MRESARNRRKVRKARVLCVQCGAASTTGSRCGRCSDAHNQSERQRYPSRANDHRRTMHESEQRRRERVISGYGGACVCCGAGEPKFLTVDHVDGLKGRRDRHLYRKLIESGFPAGFQLLCANCNQGKQLNGGSCPAHGAHLGAIKGGPTSQKQSELWRRSWRLRQKQEVFDHYGPCRCCGESQLEFLAVDHIDDDGSEHRARIGGGGATLHRWLVVNGFPAGFQSLCFNCNVGKKLNDGVCPAHRVDLRVPEGALL